jgi:hypothetical protein
MANFNIYFNGICIDTVQNSTARIARNYVNSNYKNADQCVVAEEGVDVAEAVAQSKRRHVANPEFEAQVSTVQADAELIAAARKRSGEIICFSNNVKAGTHGITVLTTDQKRVVLLEGVTMEEAREFMKNFTGRPEHVPAKVIKTKIGIVADFNEAHEIVQVTKSQGYEKRFVSVEAAQEFIDTYGDAGYGLSVADSEIVDFSYDLFSK